MSRESITQLQMIINQLNETGEVSRNWCLSRFCSRLGARIEDLEAKGWIFKPFKREGDYVYKVVSKPKVDTEIYSPEYLRIKELSKQRQLL